MGGKVGKAAAFYCTCSSLDSNPDISQKYKMCDMSKEVTNTLPAEKYSLKHMTPFLISNF
jgi:hypothetical protein